LIALGDDPNEEALAPWLPDAWQERQHDAREANAPRTPVEPLEVPRAETKWL
jgi:hypothetical protein